MSAAMGPVLGLLAQYTVCKSFVWLIDDVPEAADDLGLYDEMAAWYREECGRRAAEAGREEAIETDLPTIEETYGHFLESILEWR